MYLACEAHDVPLQSYSNLISIGYDKTYIRCEPGFFCSFSFFIFLISSHWQFFGQKITKSFKFTLENQKFGTIFLREKNSGADPLLFP
jgi:hypothetical protein